MENSQSSILSIGHTLSLASASHLFSPICSMQTDSISGSGDHSSTPMESSCFTFPSCTTFCGVNLSWKYAGPQEEDINSNSQSSWPATLWSLRAAVHHPNTTPKEPLFLIYNKPWRKPILCILYMASQPMGRRGVGGGRSVPTRTSDTVLENNRWLEVHEEHTLRSFHFH